MAHTSTNPTAQICRSSSPLKHRGQHPGQQADAALIQGHRNGAEDHARAHGGPQYDAGHAVDGGLHQQHAGIEKLMRKLTQD